MQKKEKRAKRRSEGNMALLKCKDLRAMTLEERNSRLKELRTDLMRDRGIAKMGGAPTSPGKIRAVRTNIARILTIESEIRIAEARKAGGKKKGGKE
jgi:large subunit ribosomal protein L29